MFPFVVCFLNFSSKLWTRLWQEKKTYWNFLLLKSGISHMTFFFPTFSGLCDPCTSNILLHWVTFTSALDVGRLYPVLWVDSYWIGTSELSDLSQSLLFFKDFHLPAIIMFFPLESSFPIPSLCCYKCDSTHIFYFSCSSTFCLISFFFRPFFITLPCDEISPNRRKTKEISGTNWTWDNKIN